MRARRVRRRDAASDRRGRVVLGRLGPNVRGVHARWRCVRDGPARWRTEDDRARPLHESRALADAGRGRIALHDRGRAIRAARRAARHRDVAARRRRAARYVRRHAERRRVRTASRVRAHADDRRGSPGIRRSRRPLGSGRYAVRRPQHLCAEPDAERADAGVRRSRRRGDARCVRDAAHARRSTVRRTVRADPRRLWCTTAMRRVSPALRHQRRPTGATRPMTRFTLLLALLGCGDKLHHGIDAPPPDVSIDTVGTTTGDPPPNAVKLVVTRAAMPVIGVAVVFQNPDSSLVHAGLTNEQGLAWAEIANGGYVTAIEDAGNGLEELTTFAAVQAGDALVLDFASTRDRREWPIALS